VVLNLTCYLSHCDQMWFEFQTVISDSKLSYMCNFG